MVTYQNGTRTAADGIIMQINLTFFDICGTCLIKISFEILGALPPSDMHHFANLVYHF